MRALMIGCAMVVGVWPACRAYDRSEYASLTGAEDAAIVEASTDTSTDAPGRTCALPTDGDPCSFLPRLDATQVIDARDDEFCGIPELDFVPTNGVATSGPPPSGPSVTARLRVAWSPSRPPESGLHVFIHVDKSPVLSAPASEALYLYDAVEIFAAGSSLLKGPYGGVTSSYDRGAVHIVGVPPAEAADPGRAALYAMDGTKLGDLSLSSQFATRLVEGGFEIEIGLDWGILGLSEAPGPGALVAFDFGLDLRTKSDGGTQRFQTFLAVRDASHAPGTSCTKPAPFCDDRFWCTPTLR